MGIERKLQLISYCGRGKTGTALRNQLSMSDEENGSGARDARAGTG
jgi:hypothetical protein